jgi:hypothetical protein
MVLRWTLYSLPYTYLLHALVYAMQNYIMNRPVSVLPRARVCLIISCKRYTGSLATELILGDDS